MTEHADGTVRERYDGVPHDALRRGPVWLVDRVSGRCYARAASAVMADGVLQLAGGGEIADTDIASYERVAVRNPAASDLWRGVEPGAELTLVWFDSGDVD